MAFSEGRFGGGGDDDDDSCCFLVFDCCLLVSKSNTFVDASVPSDDVGGREEGETVAVGNVSPVTCKNRYQ